MLFLKIRYRKMPEIKAKNPFIAPRLLDISIASWSHEKTANIIPKPDIRSQISFLIFIFIFSVSCSNIIKNSAVNFQHYFLFYYEKYIVFRIYIQSLRIMYFQFLRQQYLLLLTAYLKQLLHLSPFLFLFHISWMFLVYQYL